MGNQKMFQTTYQMSTEQIFAIYWNSLPPEICTGFCDSSRWPKRSPSLADAQPDEPMNPKLANQSIKAPVLLGCLMYFIDIYIYIPSTPRFSLWILVVCPWCRHGPSIHPSIHPSFYLIIYVYIYMNIYIYEYIWIYMNIYIYRCLPFELPCGQVKPPTKLTAASCVSFRTFRVSRRPPRCARPRTEEWELWKMGISVGFKWGLLWDNNG